MKLSRITIDGVGYVMRGDPHTGFPSCTVPEGESGVWKVERFEAWDEKEESVGDFIAHLKMELNGNQHMAVPPGLYTRLGYAHNERYNIMMSDTPWELQDMRAMAYIAGIGGRGLIHGLGLGCAVELCMHRGMEHVTVIEKSQDVINLVAPHLKARHGDKIEIICDDALTWKSPKGQRYNLVWHDIWPSITIDNFPEIIRLNRRYGGKSDWQGYWAEYEHQKMKREYKALVKQVRACNPPGSERHEEMEEVLAKNKAETGI